MKLKLYAFCMLNSICSPAHTSIHENTLYTFFYYYYYYWGGSIAKQDKDKLQNDVDMIYHNLLFNKLTIILASDSYPLWQEFDNRCIDRSVRFRVHQARTTCYLHFFILATMHIYNKIMTRACEDSHTADTCFFIF